MYPVSQSVSKIDVDSSRPDQARPNPQLPSVCDVQVASGGQWGPVGATGIQTIQLLSPLSLIQINLIEGKLRAKIISPGLVLWPLVLTSMLQLYL